MQVAKPKKGYKLVKTSFGKYIEIPEEWEETNLGNLIFEISEKNKQNKKFNVFSITNEKGFIQSDDYFSKEVFSKNLKNYKIVSENIIGYNPSRINVGSVAIYKNKENGLISPLYVMFKSKSELNQDYILYFLKSSQGNQKIRNSVQGSVRDSLSFKNLQRIHISLPPLLEQKQIVSILSNVDDTLQKTNQIIEQTQRLKTGMIQKLLTRGIGHTKFKTVTLCNLMNSKQVSIPNEWEVKPLKELAKINPKSIGKNYEHEYISYIDIGAIEDFQIKRYDELKLEERPSRAQKIIGKNDIIISTVRPYLKGFAIVDDSRKNLVCSTGFAVVKLHDLEDLDFVFNYVKSSFFDNNIYRHMEGISYPAVTSNDIANSPIPFPTDKKERIRIGYILSNVDTQIQKEKLHKSNLERLKKGLMQKLLTGQIRVKIK